MPDHPAHASARSRAHALAIVCVLSAASVMIAFLGVSPARVGATEALGTPRMPGDAAFIASHRGGGATAPENTLPAIDAALTQGFEYVEVDVALTADRHAVLMHDATVDRTTDGSGRISDLTLADVRTLDAGSWFSAEFAGTRVPTLAEFAISWRDHPTGDRRTQGGVGCRFPRGRRLGVREPGAHETHRARELRRSDPRSRSRRLTRHPPPADPASAPGRCRERSGGSGSTGHHRQPCRRRAQA